MPGPAPKDPGLRQRRNKVATAAKLSASPDVKAPPLPRRYRTNDSGRKVQVGWDPRTKAWWERIWASPMAGEWLDADIPGLELVAELWDAFYTSASPGERVKLSAELRLQEARFGLAPMDRRRLQWEVERGEDAAERGRRRRRKPDADSGSEGGPATPSTDPRRLLAVVPS